MKLIIIHGAPAVGKLTVAKELSKLTKYKLFHNHLTLDLVESLFDSKKEIFWKLVSKIRLNLIKEALKHKVKGIIYTRSDIASDNFEFIKKLSKVVDEKNISFIHLKCDEKELYKRVNTESRRKYLKTTCANKLKKDLKKWNFTTKSPFSKTIEIENTKKSPKNVAQLIKKQLKL